MKIYVLGSNSFMHKMVEITDNLLSLGINAFIHPDYRQLVKGERKEQIELWDAGEKARVKIENDYFRQHYAHILESDAILIVNERKNDINNYIGGNVLIEMGQAYVNNKKIFLLNNIPNNLSYSDEIKALQPICLNGDLDKLKNKNNETIKAGCVVVNENKEVLLISDKEEEIWTFPKGHAENNETLEQVALREVKEETGYEVEILKRLSDLTYSHGQTGELIRVAMFKAKPIKKITEAEEKTLSNWFSIKDAEQKIYYNLAFLLKELE